MPFHRMFTRLLGPGRPPAARRIRLQPDVPSAKIEFGEGTDALARKGLLGRRLSIGDRLTVPNINLFDAPLRFIVTLTDPLTKVTVTDATVVVLVDELENIGENTPSSGTGGGNP